MMRMITHPPTKAYVAQRTAEGLSRRQIIRCLKRYIVREIHRAITATNTLAPRVHELRRRRQELRLPLHVVAEATGTHISTLSPSSADTSTTPNSPPASTPGSTSLENLHSPLDNDRSFTPAGAHGMLETPHTGRQPSLRPRIHHWRVTSNCGTHVGEP